MIVPLLLYYLGGIGDQTSGYLTNWTVISRWSEVLTPSFYMRWLIRVDDLLMAGLVFGGILGSVLTSRRTLAVLWGLGAGYLLYGVTFPFHILTHDYYHLPLVALVSLGIMSLTQVMIERVAKRGVALQFVFIGVILLFVFYNGWLGRSILLGQDYRDHPAYWREVGEAIPRNEKTIGISQNYGFRLMYFGWRRIELWPSDGSIRDFERIADETAFFVITAKNQLEPDLAEYLDTHYSVHAQGTGYLIYDLRQGK
jgi:hypothetical protein